MKTERKTIKDFIKIISFVLVFAVLLEALSLTVFSKGSAVTYRNKYSNAYSFLQEPDHSIQVAGVGNSDLYSAFVPAALWENFGYTSTVVSSPRQSMLKSCEMLEQVFQKQSPQVVMIETDMLYKDNPERNQEAVRSDCDSLLAPVFDSLSPDNFEDMVISRLPIFAFHNKWKTIGNAKKSQPRDIHSHGYKFSSKVKKVKVDDYMVKSGQTEEILPSHLSSLDKMLTLCREKGAAVLLVEMPSPNSWSYERHNAVAAYAEEKDIAFVDFNLLTEDIKLNYKKDFRDKGNHLNYNGARKTTKYLGALLAKDYPLEDRRSNPAYSYWNDSCEQFKKDIEIQRKEEQSKAV